MARVPAYPTTDAWLWDMPDLGESLLSRREAVLVGTLARKGVAMTVADLKKEVDWWLGWDVRLVDRLRGVDRTAGDPEPFDASRTAPLDTALTTFHEVVGRMRDKGLVAAAEGKVAGPGRHATAWDLTEAGRAAAGFVALAGRALIDGRFDPEGRPSRLLHEMFDAVLSRGAVGAVVTSDAGGHRVEAMVEGRHVKVGEGTLEAHDAISRELWARRVPTMGRDTGNAFTFEWHEGRRTYQVTFEQQAHPIGTRTTLSFA